MTSNTGSFRSVRSRPFASLKRVTLAAILAHLAGSTGAFAQNSAHRPAKSGAPATNSSTANIPQPSMQSAVEPGKAQSPTVAVPKNTGLRGHKTGQPEGEKVRIDDNNIVDLHLSDEDLSAVLEMLSIQSQRNIVASKNVQARVTANLYGVTFYEALDAILNVNGYGYIEDGNFIYVYTLEEIAQIEKFNKQRVSKAISLNYLSSVDAAEFVKPLLSDGGQIKTNGKMAGFPSLGDNPVGNEEYALAATLVIYDFEENVAEIETLVRQIDTRPAQVLIEATILQTQLNEANAFGVDFAVVADMNFTEWLPLGGPLFGPNALQLGKAGGAPIPGDGGGTALNSTVGGTQGAGGMKVGIVSNDVAVFLRVLDEVTDSTVLSNPKLLCLNRQASRVLVGRKVGYLSSTSTDTATTQTVEFLDTGTQLIVRPIVSPDGMIRMELKPQVSEAVIRDVRDATGAAVTIPDEITNELSTNVLVRDGQTIVLGGLFRESTTSSRRQVPGLGDLPIIGAAFRGNDDQTERTEVIFLITPTIVNDTALAEAGQRGMEFADNARAGARAGTLWFSRDRLTNQLNVEAEKLAAEGKTEEALQKIDRSLRLQPVQAEVIGLREKLTKQKAQWPTRSVLNRIVHNEAGKSQNTAIAASSNFNYAAAQANATYTAPAWVGDTGAAPTDTTTTTTESAANTSESHAAANNTTVDTATPASETTPPTETTPSQTTADVPTDHAEPQIGADLSAQTTNPSDGFSTPASEPSTALTTLAVQPSEHPATTTPTTTEPTATATTEAAATPQTPVFAEVTEISPPFDSNTKTKSFAQLWLSPNGFFKTLWGGSGSFANTPATNPTQPTVTQVQEPVMEPGK